MSTAFIPAVFAFIFLGMAVIITSFIGIYVLRLEQDALACFVCALSATVMVLTYSVGLWITGF